MYDKQKIVKEIKQISVLMEIAGENHFKVKAFKNSAEALRKFSGNFKDIISGKIKIEGVGKGIISVLSALIENKKPNELIELEKKIPKDIIKLFQIKGLASKRIKKLYEKYNVRNIDDLRILIDSGKLDYEKGFGLKAVEQIKHGLIKLKERDKFLLLSEAEDLAEHIKKLLLKNIPDIKKVNFTGELRRIREIIKRVELIVLIDKNISELFEEKITKLFDINDITNYTSYNLYGINDYSPREIFIYVVESKEDFVKVNFKLTGTSEFVADFDLSANYKNEKDIFIANNFPYVIPELREQPIKQISKYDSDLCFDEIKGMLHFHTIRSDAYNTLEEMVLYGARLGFEYFAVTDHSKYATYANGLNESDLISQREEVNQISHKHNLKILHGNETDILPDGSLDFNDEILKTLDFVVASVHSSFGLTEDEMTNRIIRAVENPNVHVLGHPTSRLLLTRGAYPLNIKKVIDACASNLVAIEINSNPMRLDLDWRYFDYALNKGAVFSINPDAHSINEILFTKYGIKIARKAGLQKENVINFWEIDKFLDFLSTKKL